MRKVLSSKLILGRVRTGIMGSDDSYGMTGAFRVTGPHGTELTIVASEDIPNTEAEGWEHVSVSTKTRTPNWAEMCFVKDLFWGDEETVIQYHPPKSEYVNNMLYCLHLFKPTKVAVPMPPSILVGLKDKKYENISPSVARVLLEGMRNHGENQ